MNADVVFVEYSISLGLICEVHCRSDIRSLL
jgi:hypothetical protein